MPPENMREAFERAYKFAVSENERHEAMLKEAAEMITENIERIKRIEQSNNEIDQALDHRDKDRFMKLSSELKQLQHI